MLAGDAGLPCDIGLAQPQLASSERQRGEPSGADATMWPVSDVAHASRVRDTVGGSLNRAAFLLNQERADPDDPETLAALIASASRRLAELEPLEILTGDLDDRRQPIDHRNARYEDLRQVLHDQDGWSNAEHRAYFTPEWVLEHPRPQGGSRAKVEALAFGYVEAFVAGVPEKEISGILARSVKFVRYEVRPIASQMLQELGEPPLDGVEYVDIAALAHRYPRVARLGERRRYLPQLPLRTARQSRQLSASRDAVLVEVPRRLSAWLSENPVTKPSIVEELMKRSGRPDHKK